MRSFGVVGSGIAGLLTAHGLRKAGHAVTLYSDRTPQQWLTESRPTGTAARFELALDWERELGLNHWEHAAPRGQGVHLSFGQKKKNRLLTLCGQLRGNYFQAVDVRLQSARWMEDLEKRGGRVVIEKVDPARLDQLSAQHDLVIVAGGRADMAALFPRDAARSAYSAPQRKLAMIMARGAPLGFPGVPFLPVKFNFFESYGECFWVPYFHKDVGPSWSLLFEAKPGGPLDRFDGCQSGDEVVARAKEVIADVLPWDSAWAAGLQLADPNGWLVGGFAPTVREPVARLPSGRVVLGMGDTVMSLDPIAGQGANNGAKMSRNFVESVAAHDGALDEPFLRASFERFYQRHGKAGMAFSNLLLEPITPAAKSMLIAQYGCNGESGDGRQLIADTFIANFVDPQAHLQLFTDPAAAAQFIRECTGKSVPAASLSSGLRIARGQLRQLFGLDPQHPLAEQSASVAAFS